MKEKRCRARPADSIRSEKLRSAVNAREATIAFAKNEKPADTAGLRQTLPVRENLGAGEGIRTLDPDLGKVVLYH